MERTTELELIDELLELKASKSPFLDEQVVLSPVENYVSDEQFNREQVAIFRQLPHSPAHSSELDCAGAFLRCEVAGLPVLLTRDKQGAVRAFLNVCRHRGARLVEEDAGCRHRFTCPYHAWTYASSGELVGAPHFESGFEGVDKSKIGLKELPTKEAYGLIWVVPDPGGTFDFDDYFASMADEIESLGMANMVIAADDRIESAANWKIIVEGGIEAYHFRVAHRATIGPYFEDNLSSYRAYGPHMRSVLPRTTMASLSDEDREQWRVRDHANVLYTLFPTTQLLVQQDHVVWITSQPSGPGQTGLRLVTLAPKSGPLAEGKDDAYWRHNHKITMMTLEEDFEIGEGIQAGLASGANDVLTFGRFEGALDQFNRTIDAFIGKSKAA